jgi:hypothetical protein
MALQDYVPSKDGDFLTWMNNYKTQVAALAATFGLTAGEVTAVETDFTSFNTKLNTLNTKKNEQQAAATDKQTTRKNVVTRARALGKRLKAHASYTATLGQQLGIIGPEDTTDLTNAKPTLQAISVNPGAVSIGFNKSISSGIRLLSKRGAETAFTLLAVDTESPYIDTRANLAAGPETRLYQAQYITGDDPIGLLSDVLTITVPG